ncbi:hypothetical protein [Enterovirga sp.]|uniref:hypothetical protein n=1 Tax=Enterovirga sp. TaxID=2026350 RepID=UPI002D1FA977|nr:hypothetical protein [Enterovirga sp.]
MRSLSKAHLRREQVAAAHRRILDQWRERSGHSFADFADIIERAQPGTSRSDFIGIGSEVFAFIKASPAWDSLSGEGKILIFRAVQHLICTRPWRRSPLGSPEPEIDLFGSAEGVRRGEP